jgi:hypothetical protein
MLETPSHYRDRAAKARCAADEALTPALRTSFERLEANWLRLAATAELVTRDGTDDVERVNGL